MGGRKGCRPKLSYPQSIEDVAYLKAKLDSIGPKPVTHIRNYPGGNHGHPLFYRHSPDVRRVAHRMLAYLKVKHRDKLATNHRLYGLLCGLAVIMAKTELGITNRKGTGIKGIHSKRLKSRIKTYLGLQDKYKGHFSENMTAEQFNHALKVANIERKRDVENASNQHA